MDCESKVTHIDEMIDNLCNLHGDPTPTLNAIGTVSIHLFHHARVPNPLNMCASECHGVNDSDSNVVNNIR